MIWRSTTAGVMTSYTGDGIDMPWGITAGPDGALWFTNTANGNSSIGRITTGGVVSDYTGTGIEDPLSITTGPDGALWFTNELSNSVGRITTTGVVSNYTGNGVASPVGITVGADGALWFTNQNDGGPGSIGRITTSGMVSNYPGSGIDEPTEIVSGPDGALWFINEFDNTIGRISADGQITYFSSPYIQGAQDIVSGPGGTLWFTNYGNNSIAQITTSGAVTDYTGTGIVRPGSIAVGPDGALWFVNQGSDSIGRITTAGVVSDYTGPGTDGAAEITTGPDGALWFTNPGDNSIGRITTSGAVSEYTGAGIDEPLAITRGSDGALWFTEEDDLIGRITTSGVVTNFTGTGIDQPQGITSGPDGAIWFTNSGTGSDPGSIGRITTAGAVTNYTGVGISNPLGIATGIDGALWFTNGRNNSIGRITPIPGTLTNPVQFEPDSYGVSCTSTTDCTAAGAVGGAPAIATESDGTWGSPTVFSSVPSGTGQFDAVSCTESGDCTGVGTDGNGIGIYATETDGVWASAIEVPDTTELDGVSCTDSEDCTAVGTDGAAVPVYVTESDGSWGAPTAVAISPPSEYPSTQYGYFSAVSCSAAGDCTAVGYEWNPEVSGTSDYPIYASETGGVWGSYSVLPSDSGQLNGVSCTDSIDCTAVGSVSSESGNEPVYITESNGSWGPVTDVSGFPPGSGQQFGTASGTLTSVSCTDNLNCTAVGQDLNSEPTFVTEEGGAWDLAAEDPGESGQDSFNSVSCTDAFDCTAIGSDADGAGIYANTPLPPSFPTITNVPSGATYGGSFVPIVSTTGDGTTSVMSVTPLVCAVNSATVTYVGVGTCTLAAEVSAGERYAAGSGFPQSFSIGQMSQQINFTSVPSNPTFMGPAYTVTATGGGSGNPVEFSVSTPTVCALGSDGQTVSFIGTGKCTIDADQTGNSDYAAAPTATQSFSVAQASQMVSFTSSAPTQATVDGPSYSVAASATSGLPVTITVDLTARSVCSISLSRVTFSAIGTCVLDANQVGNSEYQSAPEAQQTFAVGAEIDLITSASSTIATLHKAFSFDVTTSAASGSTVKTIKEKGALPPGILFTDDAKLGVAFLTGKPKGTTTGTYDLVFKAMFVNDGMKTLVTQDFTLILMS